MVGEEKIRMSRIQLFEFTDLPWYPEVFRSMQTDYLQFSATLGSGHQNLIPLFQKAMQKASTDEIVDLCSGGMGPWLRLQEQLNLAGMQVQVKLTDLYPQPESIKHWSGKAQPGIDYLSEPVDAMHVPEHLKGMRTMFEGFHHFKPEQAKQILKGAVDQRVAIGIFDASFKPPLGYLMLVLAPVITVLTYFVITPFIKPRKFSRFLWTYLIPIVPITTSWDGVISMLRVYSPRELQVLIDSLPHPDYTWEVGKASTGTPIFDFTYLVGYPEEKAQKI